MRVSYLRSVALASLAAVAGGASAQGLVMAGSDYLHTEPGTFFDFSSMGLGIGGVDFKGVPFGPGNTDTIVQRTRDADLSAGPATIPIQLMALSLESTAPVNLQGSFFDIFVTLDMMAGKNQGQMTIDGTMAGGKFNSFFDVFVDIRLSDISNPGNQIHINGLDLGNMQGSGGWNSTPPPGAELVNGQYGDLGANHHMGGPPNGVDFFLNGIVIEKHVGFPGEHHVSTAMTPEPGSLATLGGALVGLGILGRRRR